jgi:hypothetical protein
MSRPPPTWLLIANEMLVGEVRIIPIGKHAKGSRSYHIRKMFPKKFTTATLKDKKIITGFKIKRTA